MMTSGSAFNSKLESQARLGPECRDSLCREGLSTLERHRAEAWRRRLAVLLALVVTVVFGGLVASTGNSVAAAAVCVVGLVVTGFLAARDYHAQRAFSAAFDAWRARVLSAISSDAALEPNGYLPSSFFDAAGINLQPYNRYSGDTLLHVGACSACNLRVTNVHKESRLGSKDEDETVEDDVFTGVLIRAQVQMPHPGWVILNPRRVGVPSNLRSTQVTSPMISKSYSVVADSPFVAHRILDPSKQAAFERFMSEVGQPPRVSYRDNVMAVGLEGVKLDMGRRPSLFHPIRAKDLEATARRCEEGAAFVTGVVESLAPEA